MPSFAEQTSVRFKRAFRYTKSRGFAALIATSVLLAACGDKTTEPDDHDHDHDHEPEVVSIVITSGSNSVTVPINGSQTPGPLTLNVNVDNNITVRWLNAAGQDDPHVTADEFELRINVPQGMTYTAGTGFTGKIKPTVTGGSAFTVNLFHIEEDHVDISKTVTVNVQ